MLRTDSFPLLPAACLALGVILLAGCDHATDFDGPRLIDRFGDFSLLDPLTVNRTSVDFAAGESASFAARFNKQSNWVLEIVGQESGAIKRIEGFSSELTAENANWQGSTTELPLFKDEPVTASLFFPDDAVDTTRVELVVATPRTYPGSVIASFEGSDRLSVSNPEFEFDPGFGISAEVPPAQGDGFYLMRGTDDVVVNNFFIGLITILPPAGANVFTVPTTIADELYLNAFLRGFGTPNTIAVIEVVVDGNGTGRYEANGDRIIPLGADVEFPNVGNIDFEGWQAYSEQASSFGKFGAGITDAQTQQIVAVRVVLISDANAQPSPPRQVEFGVDYLTFTAGGPLEL